MTPAIECVAPVGCTLGEGPVWDAARNRLLLIDVKVHAVLAIESTTRGVRRCPMPEAGGSIGLRAKGGLVGAFRHGFAFVDLESGAFEPIADPEKDLPGNRVNDGHVDPRGRFW